MKKTSKFLALILCVALCVALFPAAVFADGKSDYKVIAIGDSTSNGYWLSDYGKYSTAKWCPPEKHDSGLGFMDYASRRSTGYQMYDYLSKTLTEKNVVFESLTFEGMRTDELRALLDTSYKGDYFCNPDHLPHYEEMFQIYKTNHGGTDAEDVYDFYTQELSDADLIIMDCCTNNFGTYIADRLMSGHKDQMNDTPLDALDSIAPGFKKLAQDTIDKYLASLKDVLPEGMVKNLVDTVTYALTDMCVNFSVDVAKILELNPDVKLVCVGPFNIMQGLTATYEGIDIDFGNIWGTLINLANIYITTFDPHNDQFYFADVMGGVNLLIKDFAKGEFTDYYLADIRKAFGNTNETTLNLVSKAASYTHLELTDVLNMLLGDNGGDLEKTATAVAAKGVENWDGLTAGEKSLMHLFVRFFINHSATHPSESGYDQKFEAVKAAYNSSFPAVVNSGEVAADMGIHAAVGILNTIKAPIVNAINSIFSFIDFGNFFAMIIDGISQFLLNLVR